MRTVCIPIAFDEEGKIGTVVRRIREAEAVDRILLVDDASEDRTAEVARAEGAEVVSHERRRGAGAAIRTGLRWARSEGLDVAVIIAGNNKDEPREISRLLDRIRDGFDLVQGSRYLPGGGHGNMPFHRRLATRVVHPLLFSLFAGHRMTDTTNGFRAIRLSMLDDPGLDLDQPWLDAYELEPYLLFRAIRLGYRVTEVPVTKIYPPRQDGYTKMKPLSGWWSILRPIFLLGLGLRT